MTPKTFTQIDISHRHCLGRNSEAEAEIWFLQQRNAKLVVKNYRAKCGEIDLIFEEVLDSGLCELVFVEVRSKSDRNWMNGAQSLDPWKQERLRKTASHFLTRYRGLAKSQRLDLLTWDGRTWTHWSNLWI